MVLVRMRIFSCTLFYNLLGFGAHPLIRVILLLCERRRDRKQGGIVGGGIYAWLRKNQIVYGDFMHFYQNILVSLSAG